MDKGEFKLKLSKNRFLDVGRFKGKTLISIREFYEDDRGKLKPSKKGISLSLQQWTTLLENIDKISAILDLCDNE